MLYSHYIRYLGDEIKYGTHLYVAGWKKLLFHPVRTIKDTLYALYHPIQTGKILLNELKQHPLGMAVNTTLSWATGRAISSSIHYSRTINISSSNLPEFLQNATAVPESVLASVSQVLQTGTQAMGGGCCGGICTTTAARFGQTTSIITSQSTSANNQLRQTEKQTSHKSFSPYFNTLKSLKKEQGCDNTIASIKKVRRKAKK